MPKWTLSAVEAPNRFALVIDDVHLPYFPSQEALIISVFLETLGLGTQTYVLGKPKDGEPYREDGEYVRFRPVSGGMAIDYGTGTPDGEFKMGRTWAFTEEEILAIAEAIAARIPKYVA